MRRSWPVTLRRLFPAIALFLAACPRQELASLSPCTVSAATVRVDQTGLSAVDLLFVIDNSGSMAAEQGKLAMELPKLVQILTSGDRYFGSDDVPPGVTDEERYFTPVRSLHLGVVSTDMGGLDSTVGQPLSTHGCVGLGDDGKLLSSTESAITGVTGLAGDRACNLGTLPSYQTYESDDPSGSTADEVADAFRCVSRLGVDGCPYEQQLEAMWKALAPSRGNGDLYTFLNDTKGRGDGTNKGFLREDALLAVMHVSDEDDCSIRPDGKALFDSNDRTFGDQLAEVPVRCQRFGAESDLVWPAERYVTALRSLKPEHPDRIIFGAIIGMPDSANGTTDFDAVLDLPEMQFAVQRTPGLVSARPVCRQGIEDAAPGRRFLEVAKGFGEQAVVYSICSENYAPAIESLIQKIALSLGGRCLPRQLTPDDDGLVACQVYELLPPGETECDPGRGHLEPPQKREVEEDGKKVTRTACAMQQVPVLDDEPQSGMRGWYYDDFSDDLASECKPDQRQRISFAFESGAKLPTGSAATFECFQSVARVDRDAVGIDAVHTRCDDDSDVCDDKSNADEGGYDLTCIGGTCQIPCRSSGVCPGGWICESGAGGDSYCQLPTCPLGAQ